MQLINGIGQKVNGIKNMKYVNKNLFRVNIITSNNPPLNINLTIKTNTNE
ncbi:hypothetical protein EV197_1281 [Aquimarina brevivitae]|uniref:Uncharacterized protein n=1 Tax=Aquimarina brevivitae TaxID=323412 RepID=A0A4Q7PJP5_9FLAO|nr:hypothetical protein EV197_1281 [Aquimarina brevivitae]